MTRVATTVSIAAGLTFLIFGIGKFVDHGSELASFRGYGLPAPGVAVIAVGVLEIVGGTLLIARRALPLAVLALAVDMAVAIAVAGVGRGELFPSLTLAPALLAAMLYVWGAARGSASGEARNRATAGGVGRARTTGIARRLWNEQR